VYKWTIAVRLDRMAAPGFAERQIAESRSLEVAEIEAERFG
jgi:hypothetical protein